MLKPSRNQQILNLHEPLTPHRKFAIAFVGNDYVANAFKSLKAISQSLGKTVYYRQKFLLEIISHISRVIVFLNTRITTQTIEDARDAIGFLLSLKTDGTELEEIKQLACNIDIYAELFFTSGISFVPGRLTIRDQYRYRGAIWQANSNVMPSLSVILNFLPSSFQFLI